MTRRLALLPIVAVLVLAGSDAARTSATYQYVGNEFAFVDGVYSTLHG